MSVFVSDANSGGSVNVVQSLGKSGIRVIAGDNIILLATANRELIENFFTRPNKEFLEKLKGH